MEHTRSVSLLNDGVYAGPLPKRIYKYRQWGDSNHKRFLTHNELYFSSARDFNDPFDSSVLFDYQSYSESELLSTIRGHIEKKNPELSPEEIDAMAQREFENSPVRDPNRFKIVRQEVLEGIHKNYGICTFSKLRHHILMWSHYAKAHTGFCVGLNVLKLHSFLEDHFARTTDLIGHFKVFYAPKYPSYRT